MSCGLLHGVDLLHGSVELILESIKRELGHDPFSPVGTKEIDTIVVTPLLHCCRPYPWYLDTVIEEEHWCQFAGSEDPPSCDDSKARAEQRLTGSQRKPVCGSSLAGPPSPPTTVSSGPPEFTAMTGVAQYIASSGVIPKCSFAGV
mmetsp:Transcript_9737/g.29452  ORF Transcript_9737/g.29452 Transcript_9737/m.29452 type:complete len:146 (+) Transcript_9737:937-1374(+)